MNLTKVLCEHLKKKYDANPVTICGNPQIKITEWVCVSCGETWTFPLYLISILVGIITGFGKMALEWKGK